MADITFINLNMLFVRYADSCERERHLPLGLLYLTAVLEQAGFEVDFRDYQMCDAKDPFDIDALVKFVREPAPIIGLSCMANLLPFTILAAKAIKAHYPEHVIVLGGVGAKSVEKDVLNRFPWIDFVAHGEAEQSIVPLVTAIKNRKDLTDQDEFFVSSKRAVMSFCDILAKSGLKVRWKAFARVDLADEEMMQKMADTGCLEIRFGIESGSKEILEKTTKGFTPEMAVEVVSLATQLFPRVDTFFIWGYPNETMEAFYQSLFQMVSFRLMGARILPSLLCLLPQTELFRNLTQGQLERLEFCEALLPEYVITGHEVCDAGTISICDEHRVVFEFIQNNRDIFPGFFLLDVENNIKPKLAILQEHGFYTRPNRELSDLDSCGAHSPRI